MINYTRNPWITGHVGTGHRSNIAFRIQRHGSSPVNSRGGGGERALLQTQEERTRPYFGPPGVAKRIQYSLCCSVSCWEDALGRASTRDSATANFTSRPLITDPPHPHAPTSLIARENATEHYRSRQEHHTGLPTHLEPATMSVWRTPNHKLDIFTSSK